MHPTQQLPPRNPQLVRQNGTQNLRDLHRGASTNKFFLIL